VTIRAGNEPTPILRSLNLILLPMQEKKQQARISGAIAAVRIDGNDQQNNKHDEGH
jgi:hypothetical protein